MDRHATEEQLKLQEFGGAAHDRSKTAFVSAAMDSTLHGMIGRGVFQPVPDAVTERLPAIQDYIGSGRVKVLIPLREFQESGAPLIRSIITTLAEQVGPANIFISDNGIHPTIRQELAASQVTVISAEAVRARFDWNKVLDYLNLDHLDSGKGYAVMLGLAYLALEGIMDDDDWLVQCDGDITRFAQYQMLQHLFYPVVADPTTDWQYLKMAKVGRNNETVKAGINALAAHFQWVPAQNWVLGAQARVAREIYEACIHHIWILSGEFALRWRHARRRMGAVGYCEETFISAQCGWHEFGQTLNPNPRLDRPNTKRKEDCMMIRIQQFLNALIVFGESVRSPWDLDRIADFNHQIISRLNSVVWIPDDNGPVRLESFEADRVFPAIETLLEAGLLA